MLLVVWVVLPASMRGCWQLVRGRVLGNAVLAPCQPSLVFVGAERPVGRQYLVCLGVSRGTCDRYACW